MKSLLNKYIYVLMLPFILISLASCEDEVEFDTRFSDPKIVVDGWITIESKDQTIRLTQTQSFLNNNPISGVQGAQVSVTNLTKAAVDPTGNNTFEFVNTENGNYTWGSNGGSLGEVGDTMQLSISLNGEDYGSVTTVKRVPKIDSIFVKMVEPNDKIEEDKDEFEAQVYARDFEGIGDTYWIRAYKNGKFLSKPDELTTAFDAQFAPGAPVDGVTFIAPLRNSINGVSDENPGPVWYFEDDVVEVELWSISTEAYFFLSIAQEQMTNGDNTIFAVPVANAKGNVFNVNSEEPLIGIFNVAAVSRERKVIKKE